MFKDNDPKRDHAEAQYEKMIEHSELLSDHLDFLHEKFGKEDDDE